MLICQCSISLATMRYPIITDFTFDPFAATIILTVKDDLKSINLNVPNAVFAPDMGHVKTLYCTWTGAKMCQRMWIPGRPAFNIARRLFTCNMIHKGAHCSSDERAFCNRFIHNIHIHLENSFLISFSWLETAPSLTFRPLSLNSESFYTTY